MKEELQNAQIDSSKIRVDGNIAGAIFVAGTVAICLIGIPWLWYLMAGALTLGGGIAMALHFVRHETTGAPWILNGRKK